LFVTVGLTSNSEEAEQTKQDALSFLTQKAGGWAKRRNELCEAVGIDGDDMRVRVVRVLEGDTLALGTYEGRRELTHVAEARALWEYEKGALDRARETALKQRRTRPIPSKPTNTVTKYSEVRPIILALLDQPRSFKDLIIATNGDVSDSTIRDVLRIGVDKGDLIKPHNDTYLLASVPQTAVAAVTG
jgi:hypothetical protein